jgi:hypothetical protein
LPDTIKFPVSGGDARLIYDFGTPKAHGGREQSDTLDELDDETSAVFDDPDDMGYDESDYVGSAEEEIARESEMPGAVDISEVPLSLEAPNDGAGSEEDGSPAPRSLDAPGGDAAKGAGAQSVESELGESGLGAVLAGEAEFSGTESGESEFDVDAQAGGAEFGESELDVDVQAGEGELGESEFDLDAQAGGVEYVESEFNVDAQAGEGEIDESEFDLDAQADGAEYAESEFDVDAQADVAELGELEFDGDAQADGAEFDEFDDPAADGPDFGGREYEEPDAWNAAPQDAQGVFDGPDDSEPDPGAGGNAVYTEDGFLVRTGGPDASRGVGLNVEAFDDLEGNDFDGSLAELDNPDYDPVNDPASRMAPPPSASQTAVLDEADFADPLTQNPVTAQVNTRLLDAAPPFRGEAPPDDDLFGIEPDLDFSAPLEPGLEPEVDTDIPPALPPQILYSPPKAVPRVVNPESSTAVIVKYLEDNDATILPTPGPALDEDEDLDIDLMDMHYQEPARFMARPMVPVPKRHQ